MRLGICLAAALTVAGPAAAADIAEIGSFHIGGRTGHASTGMPKRELVFSARLTRRSGRRPQTASSPSSRCTCNTSAKPTRNPRQIPPPPLARRRPHRCHLGNQARRPTRLAELLHQAPATTSTSPTPSSAAAPAGPATPKSSRRNPSSAPARKPWEHVPLRPHLRRRPGQSAPPTPANNSRSTSFDQFMKQGVPRWVTNDAATQAAYDTLVQKICPCVIITHSQGGNFGFNAALHAPDKVKRPHLHRTLRRPRPGQSRHRRHPEGRPPPHPLRRQPGDNGSLLAPSSSATPTPGATKRPSPPQGGTADFDGTPKTKASHGNTHMLMMDRNSDQVAELVQDWMTRDQLMK